MARRDDVRIRVASAADAEPIAALHADSWRRHYRGAYSDVFLDGDLEADRLAVWAERLHRPDADRHTLVAEDGTGVIGFAHVIFEDDPAWGALLDNLHVEHRHKRRGIGSLLLASTAQGVIERRTGLYLWVQQQNLAAQSFYAARGGQLAGQALIAAPGGVASRLNGRPLKLRYAWPDPRVLLERP